MKRKESRKCYWYAKINDRFLFIMPNADVFIESHNGLAKMNREVFRGSDYYREPKTSNRIAVSTLKRKAERCQLLITALLLFITISVSGQDKWWKIEKRDYISMGTMFLSGYSDGTAELLKWDYGAFENYYGDVNDRFWYPEVSWRNKWNHGDPTKGEAFFGSSTVLVGTTDAYHALRTLRNTSIAATLFIMPKCESDWRTMLLRLALSIAANRLGFHMAYTIPRMVNR